MARGALLKDFGYAGETQRDHLAEVDLSLDEGLEGRVALRVEESFVGDVSQGPSELEKVFADVLPERPNAA